MSARALIFSLFFLIVAVGTFIYFVAFPPRGSQQGIDLRAQLHTGEIKRLSELPGDLRLIYFGYMNCPDVCLDAALSIGSALKNLNSDSSVGSDRVTNVFITLDPEDDVIDGVYNELQGYLEGRYSGAGFAMRPRDRKHAKKMAGAFGVSFEYVADEFFPLGYRVDHASLIFLTDKQGQILTYYADRTPGRVIAADAKTYLGQLDP